MLRKESGVLFAWLLYARVGVASAPARAKQNGVAMHVPVSRLALKGGASEGLPRSPPTEGPVQHCSACGRSVDSGRHVVVVAERRAERAERRAAELERRLEQLEREFCMAEAGLVQARADAAEAVRTAEAGLRSQFERRIAELNDRCNRAEAEVKWGNSERTRDLMVISELRHKVEDHERERSEIEDKIRREMAVETSSIPAQKPVVPLQSLKVEHEDDRVGCWCGAQGPFGGDLAGDDAWTGLEGPNGEDREGPEVLLHAENCRAGRCAFHPYKKE